MPKRLVKNAAHYLENIIAVYAIYLTKTRSSIIVKNVEFDWSKGGIFPLFEM